MIRLSLVCLSCVLGLVGCANLPAPTSSPDEGVAVRGTVSAPASAPRRAASALANSPLQPIVLTDIDSSRVVSLTPPSDLWSRIRSGFSMPDLESDLVRDREKWYAARPDYLQRMTERSSKYLFHIVEELERRGMPTELALLPYIESAFNPQAVSSAKAAGMWQFMPATGTYFDLKQNMFRDDRRDVLASTRAALDYLQKLYGMFGDWHLALAAYNWGEGNVAKAVARNQKAGLSTRYVDLNMPNETRYYVPKLQAVKNIVANPDLFRADLPEIPNHPYFDTVELPGDIDVTLAAKLAEVRLEDFKALNPAAHRAVILAAGTPEILLPWDNATIFKRNVAAYRERLASWTAWLTPSTMSVAAAAQRVGMSEYDLRNINNIPPRMLIKAGSTLLVPRSGAFDYDVTSQVAETGRLALAPEIVQKRTVTRAGKKDSVETIAQRFHVSPAQVAEWNNVKTGASFRKGESVVLFLPAQTQTRTASAAPKVATASAPARTASSKTAAPTRTARAPGKGTQSAGSAAPTRYAKR